MTTGSTHNPLVSIIVRTKDRPKLLLSALKSIANQTYRPIEVVLVNDGGCEIDINVIREILNDVTLNYIPLEKNMGRAQAGNVGIDNAKGEYIGFLDDDDEFYPEHVKLLVTSLQNSDYYDVVYAMTEIVHKEYIPQEGIYIEKSSRLFDEREFSYEDLLISNYIPFNSLLFRKKIIDKVGLLDTDFEIYEDWDLLIRCAKEKPFLHIKSITSSYNQWDSEKQVAQNVDKKEFKEFYYKIIYKHSSLRKLCDSYIEITTNLANAHKALSEKDKILYEAHKALEEKDRVLYEAHKALEEKDRVLYEAYKALEEKDRVLNETTEVLRQIQNTLTMIEGSLGWQILNSLAAQRDRFFPANTTRRRYLNKFFKAIKILKNDGITALIRKSLKIEKNSTGSESTKDPYEIWVSLEKGLSSINIKNIKFFPSIVIVIVPKTEGPLAAEIKRTIGSFLNQSYNRWSIVLPIDDKHVITNISKDIMDKRIKILETCEKMDSVESINKNLLTCDCDYIMFISQGDLISHYALYEIAQSINNTPEVEIIYSDEDCLDGERRHSPFFKSGWNPDMLRAFNYIGSNFLIKKTFYEKIGGLNNKYFDNPLLYDLLLRSLESSPSVIHIPRVLYHRTCNKPRNEQLPIHSSDAKKIKNAILSQSFPRVQKKSTCVFSLIILNKDSPQFIIPLVEFLREHKKTGKYQIIIGDTGSTNKEVISYYENVGGDLLIVRDLKYHFSSNYNYLTINFAEGDFIGIINNDIILQDIDFLSEVHAYLNKRDSGALGFKLLYPDGRLQHAGVYFFEENRHRGLPYHRLHGKPKEVLVGRKGITLVPAVTGAFMFCKREDFIRLGGFDTTYVEEAQDIDFCLKLVRIGKEIGFSLCQNIIHIENGTRPKGSSNPNDRNYFLWKWRSFLEAHILGDDINRWE